MSLGKRIKELREIAGLTQLELANKLFVSDKTISKWEKDKSEPEIDTLIKMSELFNVTLDYLTTGNVKTNNIDAISKIELACREDNIALLDGVDLESYDNAGKDINYYIDKYNAVNVSKYLTDCQFNKYINEEEYKKEKDIYFICAIPKDLTREDNLVLLRHTNIKGNIAKDCAELEKKGYHDFRVFVEKPYYKKCAFNYEHINFSILNEDGKRSILFQFNTLDDNQGAYVRLTFYNVEGRDVPINTMGYVRPEVMKTFINELDAVNLNSWENKYWGYPIYNLFYSLKHDQDDLEMLMYNKFYISPNKDLYKRFVKAFQNLVLNTIKDSWYKLFASKFNTSTNPYSHEDLPINKSEIVFSSVEGQMKLDGAYIKIKEKGVN